MSSPFDAMARRVCLWLNTAGLRQHLNDILDQMGFCPTFVQDSSGLQRLSHQEAFSILVLGIESKATASSETNELETMIRFLKGFKNRQVFTYVILLSPAALPLEMISQAVLGGVNALINYQEGDFVSRLREHLAQGRQYFLDKSSRRQDVRSSLAANGGLVGRSAALHRIIEKARRAAMVSDAPVIIFGESGTGKQRLAELIHQWDEKRNPHPFICVNCAAITGTLAESELFGHRKGAFTGATEDRPGYLRAAHLGTILLDEISELSPALQPKLLRTLQENHVRPVGSDTEYPVDARVIAATNRNLAHMVQEGGFRLDLFHRLNVIQLQVPPLRDRVEDIPLLFESFLQKYAHYYPADTIESVNPAVYELIQSHLGAGNIRELENIVRQILIFKEAGQRIEVGDLPPNLLETTSGHGGHPYAIGVPEPMIEQLAHGGKRLADAVAEYEKAMLARLMERCQNRQELADHLGITRRTLYNKIRQYQLD